MRTTSHRILYFTFAAFWVTNALLLSCVGQLDLPAGINKLQNGKSIDADVVVYNISGAVADEQGQPLQDIEVFLTGKYVNTETATFEKIDWPLDTVRTSADGKFRSSKREYACPYLEVVAADPAGRYQTDTLVFRLTVSESVLNIELPTFSLKKN